MTWISTTGCRTVRIQCCQQGGHLVHYDNTQIEGWWRMATLPPLISLTSQWNVSQSCPCHLPLSHSLRGRRWQWCSPGLSSSSWGSFPSYRSGGHQELHCKVDHTRVDKLRSLYFFFHYLRYGFKSFMPNSINMSTNTNKIVQ